MRNRVTSVLTIILTVTLVSCAQSELKGRVVKIVDGDTLEVLVHRRPWRVRLHGIDAPERRQAFGQRAREAAGQLAFGQEVRVLVHGTDRYGRVLGEVVLPDGSVLNQMLIEGGWAWHYQRYVPSERLAALEDGARKARRGLWADPHPTPPWEFRSRQRRESRSMQGLVR